MKMPVAMALNRVSASTRVEDLVGREEDHRVLEQIVVERAEELGDEKRQEPALPHQTERRTMHKLTFTSVCGFSR